MTVGNHASSARSPRAGGDHAAAAVVEGRRAPGLVVGAHISTLAGLRDGVGPSGLGRGGCFGVRRDVRQWSAPLLLTSQHVLAGHGAEAGEQVFAPVVTPSTDPVEIDGSALEPIARVGEGYDGVHSFAFPGEPSARTTRSRETSFRPVMT